MRRRLLILIFGMIVNVALSATVQFENVKRSNQAEKNGERITNRQNLILTASTSEGTHDDGVSFRVSSTGDSGPGTLRYALQNALEQNPGFAIILFDIPDSDPNYDPQFKTWTISLQTPLPVISTLDSLLINGFSQPHDPQNSAGYPIILDGAQTTGSSGLELENLDYLWIAGLQILNFDEAGIMAASIETGIIYNCVLGTNANADPGDRMNYGIFLHQVSDFQIGSGVRVGSLFIGKMNFGILISNSTNIDVWDNYFGSALFPGEYFSAADISVAIQAQNGSDNLDVRRNYFTNEGDIAIQMLSVGNSEIVRNCINADSAWSDQFGAYKKGIILNAVSTDNLIQQNTIGYCEQDAVLIDGNSIRNKITRNSISRNGGDGIVLQNGGNENMPTVDLVGIENNILQGLAGPPFTVELFADEEDEGRKFLGTTYVTDGMKFYFDLTGLKPYPFITGTVTDENGNTGRFSAPIVWKTDEPSPFIVTNTQDSGPGSLREALTAASESDTLVHIIFNIPTDDLNYDTATGTWEIYPQSNLVLNARNVVIDGWSQKESIGVDTNPDGPEIVIRGDNSPAAFGFIVIGCSSVAIQGLCIHGFAENLTLNETDSITVYDCFLGVPPTGDVRNDDSQFGITAYLVSHLRIGSDLAETGNVISGNSSYGIVLDSCSTVEIQHNLLGLTRDGSQPLFNGLASIAVRSGSDSVLISHNQIACDKVGIRFQETHHSLISHNLINTDSTFTQREIDGSGIVVTARSHDNLIMENFIGFCQIALTVTDEGTINNRISQNRMSENDFGIWLVDGGNHEIAAPVIREASSARISGNASPGQVIELFADINNQAREYIASVTANAAGEFELLQNLMTTLPNITATATDSEGNTSGFSAPVQIDDVSVNTENQTIPNQFTMSGNYPNPFNPETIIRYSVPHTTDVRITVYNIAGQHVRTLIHASKRPGNYSIQWDGKDGSGNNAPSGLYFCRMDAANFNHVIKMTLIR